MKVDPDATRAIKLVAPAKAPSRAFASVLGASAQPNSAPAQGAQGRTYGFAELGMFGRRQGDQGHGLGLGHDALPPAAKTSATVEAGAGPRAAAQAAQTYGHSAGPNHQSTDGKPGEQSLTLQAKSASRSPLSAAPPVVSITDEPPAFDQDGAGQHRSSVAQNESAEVSLVLAERDGEVQLIVGARGNVDGEELLEAFDEVLTEQGLDLLELTLDGEQVAVATQSRSRNDGDRAG